MSDWWIRTEGTHGSDESWHGPYPDSGWATREAVRLSTPLGAEDKFAELIYGQRGQKGSRLREFYLGKEYDTGGSGWYDILPSSKVDIP